MESSDPKKILIVDDDLQFVRALSTFLKGHGYSVIVAQDATFAVQYSKENISLLILDLGLPCGGGFFVLETLRKVRGNTNLPIIISTANITPEAKQRSREFGANAFIQKPYDLERLLEVIKKHLI